MTAAAEPEIRVLYLIDSLAPGGAERSLVTLARQYGRRGVDLEVAVVHDRLGLRPELEALAIPVFSLAGRGGRMGWLRRARTLVRQRRPDLVHTTLFEADVVGRVAARAAGVPVVSSLVSEVYGPAHRADPALRAWKLRAAQLLDGATARLAVRMHAVSETVADAMSRSLAYPRDRIDVVPRGRDPVELGTRSEARRARARDMLAVDDAPVVLCVARHEFPKGLDLLVPAFAELREEQPGAQLLVAGATGSQTDAVVRSVQAHGLGESVRLLGPRSDVPDLLCAADVFVLPSRREGFSGAVVEAMAMETPIVASDLPQVREAVDSSCATLVEPESVAALTAGMRSVLGDPAGASGLARAARGRFLREFAIERITDRMVAFYRSAVGAR